MSAVARKPSSGEHPAVRAFRSKLKSVEEGTLPVLGRLNARIDKLKEKSNPPPSEQDPRREDGEEVPVDVVELPEAEPDPFPPPKKGL
jgi:hypothetical protein